MINFIVYSDNKEMTSIYEKAIHKLMGVRNFNYKLYEFCKYNKEVEKKINYEIIGKKIYILDNEVIKISGLDLAKKIRDKDDWVSRIIIATSNREFNNSSFVSKSLILDFISKYSDVSIELNYSIDIAISILNRYATLAFKCNGEIFQVLYGDIYYIEKNLNNNDSTIVTKSNKYIIKYSINKLMDIFDDDPRFFKCHRSCIVNLNNIVSFDLDNNIIKFKNKEINLISRNKKRELKNRLILKSYSFKL